MTDWRSRDHLAEMWVAGKLVDAGWNVFFPHRDKGLDMIATLPVEGTVLIRPVQVKGKYPKAETGDRDTYGYRGRLSVVHQDLILAIPMFVGFDDPMPKHVAWMPRSRLVFMERGEWRYEPAKFVNGEPVPRKEYECYFDRAGLDLLSANAEPRGPDEV